MKMLHNSRFTPLWRVLQSIVASAQLNYKASKKNIVFIWLPKSAGSSVFKFLSDELCMQKRKRLKHCLSFPNRGVVTFGHISYQQLLVLGAVGKDFHDSAYKFCIVRNPYTRAVSTYNYLIQINRVKAEKTFNQFLHDVHLFRESIGLYNNRGISLSNPQADWVVGENGKLLVDDVFKVEQLDVFAKEIKKKYNVNFNPRVKINESKKKISIDEAYYDSECAELVRIIYKRDFDLFDYPEDTVPSEE